MGKYKVEITDMEGNSGRIVLTFPLLKNTANPENSSWRVLDEGFLKFRSGGCRVKSSTGHKESFVTGHLVLYVVEKYGWGVCLFNFLDEWSLANDTGSGIIHQPWVLNCKPGDIGWSLL